MIIKRPEFELVAEEDGPATLLRASGSLDMGSAELVQRSVEAAFSANRDVIFDMSGLRLCDSTGLGVLVRIHRRAQASGRTFTLRDPRPQMTELLAMTGIDKLLRVASSRTRLANG